MMSKSIDSYQGTVFKWMPLVDAALCLSGLLVKGNVKPALWLNDPSSNKKMTFCCLLNAASFFTANKICDSNDQEVSNLFKMAIAVSVCANLIIFPMLADTFGLRPDIMTFTYVAIQLAAFSFLTKVTVYFAYQIIKTIHDELTFPVYSARKDLEDMTDENIGRLKGVFESQKGTWNGLSLMLQAAFNIALVDKGQTALPFTNFLLKENEKLTKEEAEIFAQSLGDSITGKQAQILFDSHIAPEKRPYAKKEMPSLDPITAIVTDLTDSQVRWYHCFLITNSEVLLTPNQQKNFALRFYDLDLPPPNTLFVPDLALPLASAMQNPLTFGTISQNDIRGGLHACSGCAVAYLNRVLNQEAPGNLTPLIDDAVREGVRLFNQAKEQRQKGLIEFYGSVEAIPHDQKGESVAPLDVINTNKFFGNRIHSPKAITISAKEEEKITILTRALETMVQSAKTHKLRALGATVTGNGKTYAVSLHIEGEKVWFTIFDSHGNGELNQGNETAFTFRSDQINEASRLLASIVHSIPPPTEADINNMVGVLLLDPRFGAQMEKLDATGQRALATEMCMEQGQGDHNEVLFTYVTPKS